MCLFSSNLFIILFILTITIVFCNITVFWLLWLRMSLNFDIININRAMECQINLVSSSIHLSFSFPLACNEMYMIISYLLKKIHIVLFKTISCPSQAMTKYIQSFGLTSDNTNIQQDEFHSAAL